MTKATINEAAQDEFARLAAAFKKRGHSLRKVADLHTGQANYYVSAWGYCKPLSDLDEVRDFLRVIGGRQ